jgi:hypothetical protein
MKQLIYLLLLLPMLLQAQTLDFVTDHRTYYHATEQKVWQSVRVELTEAGLLTFTDQRTGWIVGRYKVQVTDRDGLIVCRAAGNNLSGRFYRAETEIRIDPVRRYAIVWRDGKAYRRYGMPQLPNVQNVTK